VRVAVLAVAVGLAFAACTSGPSQSQSPRPRPSTVSPVVHPLLTNLHQQTALRFVHLHSGANPNAVTVFTSSRNLQPGQQGVVLAVRRVGNLMGSCSPGHPAVKFRLTYRGAGPPTVTEVRKPLARPVGGLSLLGWAPAPPPVGGEQHFAFFQIVAGSEAADFSLALWVTLTPVAGGCAFSANGVLRVRCSAFADSICSYIARRGAWAHLG
jgi:hypothetical protein